MIHDLIIHNFQSHKASKFGFHPGMNIIIGTSDSGKSATIRALKWVIQNKPNGDGFRSDWGGDTSVCIADEKSVTTREKSNTKNLYNHDAETYEGFGQDVPEEVKKALNFDEINIQSQMDSPFLLSNTSGEISKYLNAIVNLDNIDISQKNLASMKRKTSQKMELISSQYKELESKQKEYSVLKEVEALVEQYESLEYDKQEVTQNGLDLAELVGKIEALIVDKNDMKDFSKDVVLIDTELRLLEEFEQSESERNELVSLVKNIVSKMKTHTELSEHILLMKEQYKKIMPDICPLCGK